MSERFCASCRGRLPPGSTTGDSAIYNPGRDSGFTLCEPCFFEEDACIEERGTNDLPDVLADYRRNVAAGPA